MHRDQAIGITSVHPMEFHRSQGVLLFVSASILRAPRETTSQHKFADLCAGICLEVVTRLLDIISAFGRRFKIYIGWV